MLNTLAAIALTSLVWAEEAPASDAPAPTSDAPTEQPDTFSGRHPSTASNEGVVRHGVRVGYVHLNQAELAGYRDPGFFALGWEAEFRLLGSEQVDFILVTNVMGLGMNQGLLLPSGNLLVGVHIGQFVELGTGVNLVITPTPLLHMIVAVAVTPKVGSLQVPIALSYVPDVDGFWKVGFTAGVNWGSK